MRQVIRIIGPLALIAGALAVLVAAGAGGAFSAAKSSTGPASAKAGRPGPRGPRGPAGPPGPSNAYATYKDGPVSIPGQITPLVTLDIPKAGNYVIFAKGFIDESGREGGTVTCQLDAHGDLDSTNVFVDFTFDTPLSLMVTHTFATPLRVDFNCGAQNLTAATVNWIKIVAIRVGSLTNTKA